MSSWLNNMSFINLYKPDDNGKQKCLVQSIFGGTFVCNYEMVPGQAIFIESNAHYFITSYYRFYYTGSQCFKGDSKTIICKHLSAVHHPTVPKPVDAPGVCAVASSEISEKHSSSRSTSSRSSWHRVVNMDFQRRIGRRRRVNPTLEPEN